MKVAIAGAGAVGRSVARELIENQHDVTLLERKPEHIDVEAIPAAHWQLGDACEVSMLELVKLHEFDVVVAATGDDKANVVLSLLAKTEFAVPRVVARVNAPRNEYNTLLTVSRLGNIVGGRGITYVNVTMDVLKQACIKMLKEGLPIFFGSDVGKYSNSQSGIMDTSLIDYELGFNVKLGMSKAQRLMTGESAMTHAMVLTAVHVVDGKPVRWRVQNSWGETAGSEGWFVMSDKWMDEFVYQAVVEPRFVSKEVRDVLDMKPKVLPRWDPMGALA